MQAITKELVEYVLRISVKGNVLHAHTHLAFLVESWGG
jgi:hypothetical protein